MKYFSVCSGIEAASVAWKPLGWTAHAFAEIEAFPSAVLAFHYPTVPNWGDLTRFKDWPDAAFDIFVGGTPCQSFSVAGLRAGLDDPRGNLALTYLAVLDRYRPRWMVWENVPGVLSADEGGALGAFLGGLGQLGYGWAYRSLDAQYFRLAQRRRRVFVVGHLGDWRRAAAVLFERESLSGHPAPRRETGEAVAGRTRTGLESGVPQYSRIYGTDEPVATMNATGSAGGAFSHAVAIPAGMRSNDADSVFISDLHAMAGAVLSTQGRLDGEVVWPNDHRVEVAHSLRADGSNRALGKNQAALVFFQVPRQSVRAFGGGMQVRRLTPRECERLQGFPDDYTLIPYRGKPAKDGPRYKVLGNSMAVPVMAWIGRRIALVEALDLEQTA